MFGGDGVPTRNWLYGGLLLGLGAIEDLRRALATEWGPRGLRVVTLYTGGIPEVVPADFPDREERGRDARRAHAPLHQTHGQGVVLPPPRSRGYGQWAGLIDARQVAGRPHLLGRCATLADVGNVAAFAASSHVRVAPQVMLIGAAVMVRA